MDVTRENFQAVLKSLDEELRNAAFLAIDTEFTGLQNGSDFRLFALDTPAERYKKIREGSKSFLVIQFGLCIFQYDKKMKAYKCKSYNFYIFPNSNGISGTPDPKFLSQASSITFLSNNGFDFNKLFREGIPYLTMADEEKLRIEVEERLKMVNVDDPTATPNNQQSNPEIPDNLKQYMEDTMKKIQLFLEDENQKDDSELILDNTNPFQRKLVFGYGREKFPNAWFESKKNDKNERVVAVQRANAAMKERLAAKQRTEKMEQMESAIGFSKVLRKITESGKLVVGHNMLLDVCHTLHQFYADLPEDYEEFKAMTNTVFPKLIDTKLMASTKPFRDAIPNSALEPLLKTLSKPPFNMGEVYPVLGFPSYDIPNSSKAHEAGYDACITGMCFIAMANYLVSIGEKSEGVIPTESPFVEPFTQKIFLMMSNDIPYLNLSGPELEPSRDHVFHLTFPKDWKTQDILQLFSAHGQVMVNWTGDTSAFVVLQRKENTHLVKNIDCEKVGCTITSYQNYISARMVRPPTKVTEEKTIEKRPAEGPPTQVKMKNKKVRFNSGEEKKKASSTQFEESNDWD